MPTVTKNKKIELGAVLEELRAIKEELRKFLLLIPSESIEEYINLPEIKKSYLQATKTLIR